MADIKDYLVDPSKQEPAGSWAEVASREWQTFGETTFRGAWSRGTQHYAEHPLQAISDVGMGVVMEAALVTPEFRIPALAAATSSGLDLAANSMKQLGNAVSRMQEVADKPETAAEHAKWAETNLGQLTFDTAVFDTTLGMSTAIPGLMKHLTWPGATSNVGTNSDKMALTSSIPLPSYETLFAQNHPHLHLGTNAFHSVLFGLGSAEKVKDATTNGGGIKK